MKKTILTLAAIATLGLGLSACSISAVEPEPIPLSKAHFGKMALDHTAISNTLNLCGTEVKDFKESLRNGFNYIAGKEIPIVSPEEATSVLVLDSLDATCIGSNYLKGNIVTFKFSFTWKFQNGMKNQGVDVTVSGASESSVKKALIAAIENMYNYTLSAHLSNLDLSSAVGGK